MPSQHEYDEQKFYEDDLERLEKIDEFIRDNQLTIDGNANDPEDPMGEEPAQPEVS